ncbi:sodium:solute symporter [Algoriphagus halophytocola]|uniref:Sodium:solute symporter n=1 Tax=Algoriphagus halophytocola TaxID=2991499 RepID=A0ABY6MLD7_9BACT|nr:MULTISPECIES: sodium:solute symporter [unclassified Algoriphagus]UZD23789.1 sodium:solute symporter [Algoriphagus sp. TR-M5]WBL45083.1 sodium:solute symporter [Algoriphagus sp. TR-M9]
MSGLDWVVLFGTLGLITSYGVYKTYGKNSLDSYLRGKNSMNWWTIGLSIMATQASAITFLSTPGQAYEDGMRFLQFYLGLPLAMIIISVTFIPIYYKLKVYTAYEFLENRFDLKTRTLAALLFIIQRGLAAGITIYAPAIILSTLLGWNLTFTNVLIGSIVILYTVSGGTEAVSITQKQQMAVMMGGMILAGIIVIQMLPISFQEAMHVAGKMEKLNLVNFEFDISDRYNVWSGMTAAVFLFLSYFGTDQSQVQRYLSGQTLSQSRMGLIMNGFLKIPMQFIILFIGVMVFVFYQFFMPPVVFNKVQTDKLRASEYAGQFEVLEEKYALNFEESKASYLEMLDAINADNEPKTRELQADLKSLKKEQGAIREEVKELIVTNDPVAETRDTDYVFMRFVMDNLPKGIIGLLFAVIFSAAMSSTASELNALGSTTTVDLYKRSVKRNAKDRHYLYSSKLFTAFWGIGAILFATYASLFENLIQAVNLLGSLFYGTILGVFLVAFFMKWVKGNAVFIAALLSQALILFVHFNNGNVSDGNLWNIGFLWYNPLGCIAVMFFSAILQLFIPSKK